MISLFCRIQSLLQGSFAKETYNFKEPTNHSHPIPPHPTHNVSHTNLRIGEGSPVCRAASTHVKKELGGRPLQRVFLGVVPDIPGLLKTWRRVQNRAVNQNKQGPEKGDFVFSVPSSCGPLDNSLYLPPCSLKCPGFLFVPRKSQFEEGPEGGLSNSVSGGGWGGGLKKSLYSPDFFGGVFDSRSSFRNLHDNSTY